ncbi:uncharacterized protein LOC107267550 [Cephus cinctus]|uniref:Uncharacterized protein LOC107267550 n=1 Tax=Cephus cinctus TaxID=211228 RepID=A0AAJ7FJH2_CEPCN|nr:uncharacterized protein LOC107267550 [Cephus cinctus]
MDYDSESSCEGRLRDLEASEELPRTRLSNQSDLLPHKINSVPWQSLAVANAQSKVALSIANKSLSSQVMEYYQKYSQNSNLDQYFSLPASSTSTEYYYSIYELNPKAGTSKQDCTGQDYNSGTYVPKERRRWVRPPLIGQSSAGEGSSMYMQALTDPRSLSPNQKHTMPETIPEEKNKSQESIPDVGERKTASPTSSVASHKPLEWDSGADVGYFNALPGNKQINKKFSTIERMALARGCSAALRLDPEGTTESGASTKASTTQGIQKSLKEPNANSTPLVGNISGSENEVEITPIMKNHLPGIITGIDIASEERNSSKDSKHQRSSNPASKNNDQNFETPKSSLEFKVPIMKYATEGKRCKTKQNPSNENLVTCSSPLKKSSSMNLLAPTSTKLSLKRSQSELNLCVKDKSKMLLPLIFNSTSSIATVVQKPVTCDKLIQTSITSCTRESVGVQVSVLEEEKPPLPKRGTSLTQKSLQSILKNSKNTYKLPNPENFNEEQSTRRRSNSDDQSEGNVTRNSTSEISHSESLPLPPQPDDMENVTGRANSFEYFPGHIYENVPNGSASHVSSIDTGRSNSTMPNTSSSIDEKLWGDSDSLVRDLERSVNILKSLVDANKCDKQVKKRLIHHVIKRLVTAKYTDDKIEHNLEENVPWNPDDARKKVYRAEIIQALTKKQNTTDSSDEWKPQKKKIPYSKNSLENDIRVVKEIINLESSNSDKFDGHTDRTETDGRKARMELRTDDCQHSSNTPTDPNKSESSECFLPQRTDKNNKVKNIFCLKKKCDLPPEDTTTSNSTPSDQNRMLLEALVNNRQSRIDSSNGTGNSVDWRFPTTLSERRFQLGRCNHSDSGDTRLVNYAEMEKRKQLVWITNEISHLSNLKKLLEQSKKSERPKSSPRKTKHVVSNQQPVTLLTCIRGKKDHSSLQKDSPDLCESSIIEQWSSHCNLANCNASTGPSTKPIKHLRKRNSCTQTATNIAVAHSKIGAEIVSALKLQNSAVKSTNIYVQTHPQQTAPPPAINHLQITPCIPYPVHQACVHSSTCRCIGNVCHCRRHIVQNTQNACAYHSQLQNHQIFLNGCHRTSAPYFNEDRPFITQPVTPDSPSKVCGQPSNICHHTDPDNSNFRQKEAKNKLNATKIKCTCECQDPHFCQCREEFQQKDLEGNEVLRRKASETTCQLCSKRIDESDNNTDAQSSHESNDRGLCECPNDCTCEHPRMEEIKECTCLTVCNNEKVEQVQNKDRQNHCEANDDVHDQDNQKQSTKLCRCSTDCTCENKRIKQVQSIQKLCACRKDCKCDNERISQYDCLYHVKSLEGRKEQVRPYYLVNSHENQKARQSKVQSNPKCNCDKDCSCANKIKDIQDKLYNGRYTGKSSHTSETRSNDSDKNCKCCRKCGRSYQNDRKCSCHINYPKPVAYELSFGNENEERNSDNFLSKKGNIEIKSLRRMGSINSPPYTARSGGCSCEEIKSYQASKNGDQRNTLQDYLATNKPTFVSNVETRRQYMSEISQLRQLRNEKRVQLLAMATGSNIIKTSRSPKPRVCVQRKISEKEMKDRLRKRYLKLNEVRTKRHQLQIQEEARRNKLMARIFCKKLQQKVLRGQVDLPNSVSVISNM